MQGSISPEIPGIGVSPPVYKTYHGLGIPRQYGLHKGSVSRNIPGFKVCFVVEEQCLNIYCSYAYRIVKGGLPVEGMGINVKAQGDQDIRRP